MRRRTFRKYRFISKSLLISGFVLTALWHLGSILFGLPDLGWWSLALPLPGLLAWGGATAAPYLASASLLRHSHYFRLLYMSSADFVDSKAGKALTHLAEAAGGLDLLFAREGSGMGIWLGLPAEFVPTLKRLVRETLPDGMVEDEPLPKVTSGVVVLRWQVQPPAPADLCAIGGVEGVLFRWRAPGSAVVALWGPEVKQAVRSLAAEVDLLEGAGDKLWQPRFIGDNPWPEIPPLPSAHGNPELEAISRFRVLDPSLQVCPPALVMGRDSESAPVGFSLPDLNDTKVTWLLGSSAGELAVRLAGQAIRAGIQTFFLDGSGSAAGPLGQQVIQQTLKDQVLLCDLDRPAQSRFRLNPLWLPPDPTFRPQAIEVWWHWLDDFGVTRGGLGPVIYRHTMSAVALTAIVAAAKNLTLDPPRLRETLEAPDFLRRVDPKLVQPLLDPETYKWWVEQGRQTPDFDARLRLGHLRDQLDKLMALPEYSLLWQPPYLDPAAILAEKISLIWRVSAASGRHAPLLHSQLLALTTLLQSKTDPTPVVLVFHEVPPLHWARTLGQYPCVRFVIASTHFSRSTDLPRPITLAVSRTGKDDAAVLSKHLPDVRPADLQRLPTGRFLVRRGQAMTTIDL